MKVKVGIDPETDLDRVRAVRLAVGKFFGDDDNIEVTIDRQRGLIYAKKGDQEIDPHSGELGRIAAQAAKQQMIQLFSKIKTAVTEVATAKGLNLVIAEQRPQLPENTDQLNPDQLAAILNGQNIFFSNPNIDITNDVITAMDAKYKSGK